MSTSLRVQRHIIQPDVIGLLLPISVHLEGDVDLIGVPVRLRRVIRIHIVSLIVDLQRDVAPGSPRAPESRQVESRCSMGNACTEHWSAT